MIKMKARDMFTIKYIKKFKIAFTLAEVLITLGIIGLVAALTVPSLIIRQQKQVTATRLSKVFSTINQAYLNAQNEMGPSQSWSPPSAQWDLTASNTWWNTNFLPYAKFSAIKTCTSVNGYTPANASECQITGITNLDGTTYTGTFTCTCGGCYVLNDGTTIMFSGVGNNWADIFIDINGQSGPNVQGKDIFSMDIGYTAGTIYFQGKGNSRVTLLSDANKMCNKQASASTNKGVYCGALIQMDGWKISDDYPW